MSTSPSSSSSEVSSSPDGAVTTAKITSGEPSVATRLSFAFTNLLGPTYNGNSWDSHDSPMDLIYDSCPIRWSGKILY